MSTKDKAPVNPFESFETVDLPDPATKRAESVAYLAPTIQKIAESGKVVRFTLATEGLNAEIEKLRLAARVQGFSLRTVSREQQSDGQTVLQVKLGKLVQRRTAEQLAAEAEVGASPEAAPATEV
jgi:hypothetical protein